MFKVYPKIDQKMGLLRGDFLWAELISGDDKTKKLKFDTFGPT